MFGDNTARNAKFHRPIIDRIGLVQVQLRPGVFKAATATKIYCGLGRSWGIVSMLKSLQKQLQRRHKQQCLKIDTLFRRLMFFGRPFNRFKRQQETMRGRHFWYTRYRVPPLQSCGIAECLRSFPSAFERPNIPVVR